MTATPPRPSTPLGILAIDTSTEWAGIALATPTGLRHRVWNAGRSQTTTVLPAINALLTDAALAPTTLTALVVATGPGTFTGLRVGLSITKGIALARDLPVVGISTFAITFATTDADHAIALLPAGRGRIVWQERRAGQLRPPVNGTVPELLANLADSPDSLITGELHDPLRAELEAGHPLVHWQLRDPAILLRLGAQRLAAGDTDDPVSLEPLYLHGQTVTAGPVQDRLRNT